MEEDRLPPNLKRKRPVYRICEEERREAIKFGLSLETRARRKREWLKLKEENAGLRKEREEMLRKIEHLERKFGETVSSPEDAWIASENEILRAEIEEHRAFIENFVALASTEPLKKEKGDVIFKEGAQAAQTYLSSLVSESQRDWEPLKLPALISALQMYEKMVMAYKLSTDAGGSSRLSIRCDVQIKDCKVDVLADVFWRMFSIEEDQSRMYGQTNFKLKPLHDTRDTRVVHFRRKYEGRKDHDHVFVVNRTNEQLPKSTLLPPRGDLKKKKRRPTNMKDFPDEFGKVDATCVAATSTSLFGEVSNETERIKQLIAKGAVIWADGEDARAVVIYSVPEEYNVCPDLTCKDCITNGTPSFSFIRLVTSVSLRFYNTLRAV